MIFSLVWFFFLERKSMMIGPGAGIDVFAAASLNAPLRVITESFGKS